MKITFPLLHGQKKMLFRQVQDKKLLQISRNFLKRSAQYRYSYNFRWLGRPIIQYPQDILAMQDLIYTVKPDLIIETGIAHGGSVIFSSSMLELINPKGKVVGIDIDIRKHNRIEIEKHPMSKRIKMIEGSSTDQKIVDQVKRIAKNHQKIMVFLDSSHTEEHVFQELQLYSPLVSLGSYIVVFDTVVEFMPESAFSDRPWGKGNNPFTAVKKFLKTNTGFIPDLSYDNRFLITVAPNGFLRRTSL